MTSKELSIEVPCDDGVPDRFRASSFRVRIENPCNIFYVPGSVETQQKPTPDGIGDLCERKPSECYRRRFRRSIP